MSRLCMCVRAHACAHILISKTTQKISFWEELNDPGLKIPKG